MAGRKHSCDHCHLSVYLAKVGFNNDMMSLNFEPPHLKQSEEKLMQLFDNHEKTVLFVSVGKDMNRATETYAETNRKLAALKEQGLIKDYASASQFLISPQEQQKRLEKWQSYWTMIGKNRFMRTWKLPQRATVSVPEASILSVNGWMAPFMSMSIMHNRRTYPANC